MIWQDILMMVGGFGTACAVIPALLSSKDKPPRSTCLLTAIILTSYTGAMATLDLPLSALGVGLTAALWWVLLFQRRTK